MSSIAKLVKSVGPLLSLLPRRFRVDPSSGRAFGAEGGRGKKWRCCFVVTTRIRPCTHCAVSASATPSFNERSECPEEGWPCRAGEESLHRERHRKAGEEHRGRDAPAPRAERIAAKSA